MAVNKVIYKNKFNREVSKKFYTFHILKSSVFMYFVTAMGIFSLILLLTGETEPDVTSFMYIFSWSITFIGLVFVPLYLFFSVQKAVAREEKTREGNEEIFEFTKERIQRTESNTNKKIALNWLKIAKVYETNLAFYFYTTNDAAFLVPKIGLIEGTIDGMRSLIRNYLKPDNKGRIPYIVKDKEYKQILKAEKKALKTK